jgi:hypothetical protein
MRKDAVVSFASRSASAVKRLKLEPWETDWSFLQAFF